MLFYRIFILEHFCAHTRSIIEILPVGISAKIKISVAKIPVYFIKRMNKNAPYYLLQPDYRGFASANE